VTKEKKEGIKWERIVSDRVTREGGKEPPKDTKAKDIIRDFNIRAVEYGNYVKDKDAEAFGPIVLQIPSSREVYVFESFRSLRLPRLSCYSKTILKLPRSIKQRSWPKARLKKGNLFPGPLLRSRQKREV
jgi:hypothetical protein